MLHLNLLRELSCRISSYDTTRSSCSVFLNIGGSEGEHVVVVVFVINSLLFLCKGHSADSSGLSLLLTSPICFHTGSCDANTALLVDTYQSVVISSIPVSGLFPSVFRCHFLIQIIIGRQTKKTRMLYLVTVLCAMESCPFRHIIVWL